MKKEMDVPRMGNAVSSRWFMRPCVYFCLRGRQAFKRRSALRGCACIDFTLSLPVSGVPGHYKNVFLLQCMLCKITSCRSLSIFQQELCIHD